ncbi:unnamed protein product, partial [Laminaria digitata]
RYALAAQVGSHRLRIRAGNPDVVLSFGRAVGGGGGGGGVGEQPATEEAKKPWGCTALEGLYLNGQGEVQDYWAMATEMNARRSRQTLAGLPEMLFGMCEGSPSASSKSLDSGGLVAFLHASGQYQLALPLVGLAVDWQWRLKHEPDSMVLTAIARGFLYSAEAVARSGGRGLSSA